MPDMLPQPVESILAVVIAVTFALLLAIIALYGVHRLWLVWRFLRARRLLARGPKETRPFDATDAPMVTVQLPVFNEGAFVERLLAAVTEMDWPRERLEIQLLDDSNDPESIRIAERACAMAKSRGFAVHHIRRSDRAGFKAGALAHGLTTARGEYLAIFDADFVPPPAFLTQLVPSFEDDSVGLVQAAWGHLNPDDSALTACQALALDGHFVVEQTARFASGRWFNFNGTAGIWRRRAIDDAGGWSHETLTEDADLSYRAQLAGWRFVYRPDVRCPATLPPTMQAFLSQQHRWNKGLIQTGVKLLPRILRAPVPWRVRFEAFMHLTAPALYPVMLIFALLAWPGLMIALPVRGMNEAWMMWAFAGAVLSTGVGAASVYYLASQWMPRPGRWSRFARTLLLLPMLLALGIGISVVNTRAVVGAIFRRSTPFIRTPKSREAAARDQALRGSPRQPMWPAGAAELLIGAMTLTACAAALVLPNTLIGTPFLLLFAGGFLAVGAGRLRAA